MLPALLLLVGAAAQAADAGPVRARFEQLGEVIRLTPERAQPLLAELEAPARRTPSEHALLLVLSCDLAHRLGQHEESLRLCEQAEQLGRKARDNDVVARALLSKAYAVFGLNEMGQAHQLAWEAERLSTGTSNMDLRVRAVISSGESFAEEGNFPAALAKIQSALTLARQSGNPLLVIISLDSLAYLYSQMREIRKGFDAVDEAERLCAGLDSPGRMAVLKTTEYLLAVNPEDVERGTKALLTALALARRIGADAMIANTLVNLSDVYLKQHDWHHALTYAQQALEQSLKQHNDATAATAQVNIVPRGSLDEVARRLLAGIPARTIAYQGTQLSVNVSIGFAPFPLVPGAASISWERAINIVDMALYLAKGHGRNRAYGVRGLSGLDAASMDEIEQDIEQAWRAGLVDLSIVTAQVPELRLVS